MRTCVRYDIERGLIQPVSSLVGQWEPSCGTGRRPELQHVGLAEALELTLLILAKEPTRFRAAALRWHARYCGDNRVSLKEATAVLGLLAMLDGRRGKTAAQALAGLLNSRTLLPASEVLMRWADKS